MFIRDLNGSEYLLQATTTTNIKLNGNHSLSLQIIPTKANSQFIHDVSEMWQITTGGMTYKIVYAKRKGEGRLMSVDVKAVPLFFDDFDTQRIYKRYDQHMTARKCFDIIFEGSGYRFELLDDFSAIQWEGFGDGDTRLTLFKNAINRYKAEFRIENDTIYLEKQIGRDTSFMYRYKLNASNIVQEIDAGSFYTYAKGYGDYKEGEEQDAKLIREYTSPLANISGIGKREAPPIKNGNITNTDTMDEQLKTLVDESLQISVSTDIHDLRNQGYSLAQPEVGDRVFLIDERIGLNEEVRVVDQTVIKDWKGRVIDLTLILGTEGLTERHQSRLNTATKQITNILEGREKMPFSVLPSAKQAAMRKLEEAQTELIFGNAENGVQGMIAQDKNDPNRLMWMNSSGWMISVDGGVTPKVAATAEGIVADVIYTGQLNADRVTIYGGNANDYTEISGSTIFSLKGTDDTTISGGNIFSRGDFSRTFKSGGQAFYRTLITSGNGVYRIAVLEKNDENGNSLTTQSELESRGLYLNDKGLSSQPDNFGESTNQTGRYIDLFAKETYDEYFTYSGMKLFSDSGIVVESFDSSLVLKSDSSNNVESSYSSLFFRPMRDSRPGNNVFQFYIKDDSSSANTDGVVTFGSDVNGMASGVRFSKSQPRVYLTNGNGTEGTGDLECRNIYSYNMRAWNIIGNNPGSSLYVGVSNAELAVTDNNLYNNGNPVYRPVRASEFHPPSSTRESKKAIKKLEQSTIDTFRTTNVYEFLYKFQSDDEKKSISIMLDEAPECIHSENGDTVNLYSTIGYLWKGIKDLINLIDNQSDEIKIMKEKLT